MEEVAVTSVPAATEPKSAGDIVGRITPKGMNSPIRSTCLTRELSYPRVLPTQNRLLVRPCVTPSPLSSSHCVAAE